MDESKAPKRIYVLGAAICMAFLAMASLFAADPKVEALKRRVESESFIDGKKVAARELALMKGAEARAALLSFLDSDDSWTQAAAFEVILGLADPALDPGLVKLYAEDSFLRSSVEEAFRAQASRLLPLIASRYREAAGDDDQRLALLSSLSAAQGQAAADFLSSIVLDSASPDREAAFDSYLGLRRPKDLAFVRSLCADSTLGPRALAALARLGSVEDLPRFQAAFTNEERSDVRVAAMSGIGRFGSEALRASVFLEALGSGDALVAEASLSEFASLRSPSLQAAAAALCARESLSGGDPFLALAAGTYVASYPGESAIPLAAPALRAVYLESRAAPGFFDWFANLVTVGLAGIMDEHRRIRVRAEFESSRGALAKRLSALAKTSIGPDYPAWESYCVDRGWTVAGTSLLSHLFSGDAQARARARRAAAALLKFRDETALAAAIPGYAGLSDFDRSIEIAQRLRKAGYPRSWDGPAP
jgi:hypothetical protein